MEAYTITLYALYQSELTQGITVLSSQMPRTLWQSKIINAGDKITM